MTDNVTIKNRWTGATIFSAEIGASISGYGLRLGAAVKLALNSRADLTRADLTDAVLTDAVLTGAVLTDAVLTRADLTRAVLTDAVLTRAVLTRAVLTDAVLTRADLTDAVLTRAVLTDAVLTRAVLTRADLTDAVLTRAVLTDAVLTGAVLTRAVGLASDAWELRPIKADLWEILHHAKAEVPGLLAAIRDGRVDGSTYEGDCACLVGTIAKVRGCSVLWGIPRDAARPAERWFMGINPGDKPSGNTASAFAEKWIVEFMELAGMPVPA